MHRLLILALAALPSFALAGLGDPPKDGPQLGDTLTRGPNDVLIIINNFIDWMFTILLVAAVICLLVAAFKYLTSAGNEEKIQTAHKMIIWAMVAIAVAMLSAGVRTLVESLIESPSEAPGIMPPGGSLDIYNSIGGPA